MRVAAMSVVILLAWHAGPAPAAAGVGEPIVQASDQRQPPVRFSGGLLLGTGYAWQTGTGDINADVTFAGSGRAALGHIAPELTLLFPRERLFASLALRYQVISGTTDVYSAGHVYHARDHAVAFFQKFGWFPREASARLQPYVSVAAGQGTIARLARDPTLVSCGPTQNQECVDTVVLGPLFLGAGGGMRARLTDHLDALVAVESQLGFHGLFHDRGYNLDVNLGLAAVF